MNNVESNEIHAVISDNENDEGNIEIQEFNVPIKENTNLLKRNIEQVEKKDINKKKKVKKIEDQNEELIKLIKKWIGKTWKIKIKKDPKIKKIENGWKISYKTKYCFLKGGYHKHNSTNILIYENNMSCRISCSHDKCKNDTSKDLILQNHQIYKKNFFIYLFLIF